MSSQEESNNSDTSSDGGFYGLAGLAGLGAALGAYAGGRYFATPLATHHPSMFPHLTSRQWVELNLHDSVRCYNNFRMQPTAFMQPHQLLDRFERSLDTISRKMGNVPDAMFSFAHTIIVPKDPNYTQLHPRLLPYAPYFDGCIGAVDGTHIQARINHDSRLDFINRKGCTNFNVLAIVDMGMRFTYVGAGRAGSCHDMAVLWDCMAMANYPHPPPGYTLDKGYFGAVPQCMVPSQRVQEKFNYHHASLRNVVERAFGVLKEKWHILREVSFFAREKQTKMIIACCAVHNFLLDRALELQPERSMPRNVDYDVFVGGCKCNYGYGHCARLDLAWNQLHVVH
ncbi:LOW QUALITY PROTEIN: hypothetical protein U9M48_024057, partial [Paspalum notatum var. saurae]